MRRLVTSVLVLAAAVALLTAILLPPRIGHPFTPFMESAAEGITGQSVTRLPVDHGRATVVVFVLPDCPCSIEYEPFVNRMHRAYGDRTAFMEIVAGDDAEARQWKDRYSCPFPVISDVDKKFAREVGATRSAYTALVHNGRIVKLWPGYSIGMLHELGERISEVTGGAIGPIDVEGAPDRLTAGCLL